MLCISLKTTDPYFNLAADEYFLRKSREEFLLVGINAPSVIIGKHQAAHIEADTRFATANNIPVVRRISGGGTVYHDLGNLNFSFISNSSSGRQVDFRKYTRPVIEFLLTLGVEARFEGKNDLRVNGLKISGNAEHIFRERVLHHGTLLFESDLDALHGSLRNDKSCYSSRSVASNPSKVTNLNECNIQVGNTEDIRQKMLGYFLGLPGNSERILTSDEVQGITSLAEEKYRTWEWNYAYGPPYDFEKKTNVNGTDIVVRLNVKEGLIEQFTIEGDAGLEDLARGLAGCRHMPADIRNYFEKNELSLADNQVFSFF